MSELMNFDEVRARTRRSGAVVRALCVPVALGALLTSTATAIADPAVYAGASVDGEKVFFTTTEKLVPGDTDNKRDVYERFYEAEPGIESYVTREVSTGPAGGNDAYDVTYDGVSSDGVRVFFSTAESLVSEDKDLSTDVYMRNLNNGATTLISKADPSCSVPGCGDAALSASFDAVSSDGSRVVFSTEESLNSADQGSVEDVYLREIAANETIPVSVPAPSCPMSECGSGTPSFFDAASADALVVAFSSEEQLSGEDTDSADDIYVRDVSGPATHLVSPEGPCPEGLGEGECTPIFGGISSDGSHVFYETGERVAGGLDSDERQDVYGWSGAAPELVSTGLGGGNGPANATYRGTTSDGSAVFFGSDEPLSEEDEDTTGADVYMRSGSTTTLISTGPTDSGAAVPAEFEKATPDGSRAIFSTAAKLTEEDADSSRDIYSRDVGAETTELISRAGPGCGGTCGNGALDASFAGASGDGADVFFETSEPLVESDTDASPDVYERVGGATTLISTGPMSKNGVSNSHLADVSQDGAHALLTTEERLTVDDLDTETDVYERFGGGTLLVSTRNPAELVLGPATPTLTGTNPLSPAPSTEPGVRGEADVETAIKLYVTPDCSGAPVATGSGAELEASGIPVKVTAGSTTTFHATATLLNDTSGCSTTSVTYQQVAEGGGGGGGGGGGTGGGTGSGGATGGGSKSGGASQTGVGEQHLVPRTRITFGPASKTRQRRPTFQFVDSTGQQGTQFLCAIDRGHWRACSSPTKLKKLGHGRHLFKVKGINSDLQEPAAAARAFRVVSR
jgi:Tol biopolymer transport system component